MMGNKSSTNYNNFHRDVEFAITRDSSFMFSSCREQSELEILFRVGSGLAPLLPYSTEFNVTHC
jgi:hypothetical protein